MYTPVILVLVYAIRIVMREDIPGTSRIEFFGPVGNWPGEYPKSLMRSCVWDNDTMVCGFVSLDVLKLGMIDFYFIVLEDKFIALRSNPSGTTLKKWCLSWTPQRGSLHPCSFCWANQKSPPGEAEIQSSPLYCPIEIYPSYEAPFPSITIAFGVFAPITHFRGDLNTVHWSAMHLIIEDQFRSLVS